MAIRRATRRKSLRLEPISDMTHSPVFSGELCQHPMVSVEKGPAAEQLKQAPMLWEAARLIDCFCISYNVGS